MTVLSKRDYIEELCKKNNTAHMCIYIYIYIEDFKGLLKLLAFSISGKNVLRYNKECRDKR